jgi:hypothetical protein
MSSLRENLESLAASFAIEVVRAIQGSSLEELVGEVSAGSRRGRPAAAGSAPKAVRRAKGGRLSRRSSEDIAAALERIVGVLRKQQDGMRAEQIRKALHMQAKEMPRVLSEGLAKRKLKKKGQKRATTYFAT